jgi:YD repeat-containing protein
MFGGQVLTCIAGYKADGVLTQRDFMDPYTDWEPDDFSYHFGNQAGQFVFNQQKQLSFVQKEKLLLTYNSSNSSWKAITADGYQYFFETSATSYTEGAAANNSGENEWYLTKIRTPSGEEASFIYEAANTAVMSQPNQYKYQTKERTGSLVPGEPTEEATNSYSRSQVRYLARINFSTGYLLFQRNTQPRLDLDGGQSLQTIKLFSTNGSLIKEIAFNTSYFETPQALTYNNFSPSANIYKDKRLRLDAVVEKTAAGVAKPATAFFYNASPLPSKTSYDIDYWGFYNGPKNNTDLLPRYEGLMGVSGTYGVIPGADREPDATAMKALVLQKITYPTGASTFFTFEPNQYSNLQTKDIYVSAGQQVFSCIRDDVHPYYNTPVQTIIIKNQTPEWGGNDPTQMHVSLLFTDNIPSDFQSKGALRVELTGPNGFVKGWGFTNAEYSNNAITSKQIDEYVALMPGTYQLTAYSTNKPLAYPQQLDLRGEVSFPAYQRRYNMLGGGLRVAKIVNRDGSGRSNVTRTYEYLGSYQQDAAGQQVSVSSGLIMSKPLFTRLISLANEAKLFQLCSASLTSASAPVTYSQVTTYVDSLKLGGKQVQYFTNLPEREPLYSQRTPGVPNRRNLTNGYQEGEEVYEKTASGYQLKKYTGTSYEQIINPDIRAIYRGAMHKGYDTTGNSVDMFQDMYYYPVVTGWVRPTTTVVRDYSPTGNLTQSTSLFYDTSNNGHMQVSRTETQRSDGSTMVTRMTYPADYPAVTTGPLAAMRSDALFQHSAVVESLTQVYSPTETLAQARTIAGSYTEYTQPNTGSSYLPATQQTLDLAQPTAAFGAAAPNLPPTGRYLPKMQLSYDPASANPQQAQRPQDIPTTYLWGYQNTLLLASVQNASASQVQNALASLGISLATLAGATDEAQLRSTFGQLRQRLPQARITSFTHQPLVGLTTQTRPDGRLLRYEYDDFQRLLRVRDEQGRILTQQEYKYGL